MPAAAGGVEPEDIARGERVIGVAGRQAFGRAAVRVDPEVAAAAVAAAGTAVRGDRMLHGADREARIGEIEIFAADAQPAAELARAARIHDQLEAREAGGKFALDDLDRRDLGIALIDRDAGSPVLARARAGAAGDDLVLHVTFAGIGVAAAENDGAAAAAVGTHLARHHVAHGVEDGVHQRMDGGIVGVDRRREARVEHATVARRHGEAANEAARHIHVRIDQRDECVGAGRLHQGRADICGGPWVVPPDAGNYKNKVFAAIYVLPRTPPTVGYATFLLSPNSPPPKSPGSVL